MITSVEIMAITGCSEQQAALLLQEIRKERVVEHHVLDVDGTARLLATFDITADMQDDGFQIEGIDLYHVLETGRWWRIYSYEFDPAKFGESDPPILPVFNLVLRGHRSKETLEPVA